MYESLTSIYFTHLCMSRFIVAAIEFNVVAWQVENRNVPVSGLYENASSSSLLFSFCFFCMSY